MIRRTVLALRRVLAWLDARRRSRVRAVFELYGSLPTGLPGEAIAARRAAADRAGLAFLHQRAQAASDERTVP